MNEGPLDPFEVVHDPTIGLAEVKPRIDVYRVRGCWRPLNPVFPKPVFVPFHRWSRTWQAEWDGCQRAVRAYTEWGVRRKAERAIRAWMDNW